MNINQIIIKSFSSTLSAAENKLLNEWLSENDENEKSYLKLKQLHTLGRMRIPISTKEEEEIIFSAKENIFKNISKRKRSLYRNFMTKYAAVLIGFIIIGAGGYYLINQTNKQSFISEKESDMVNLSATRLEPVIIKDNNIIPLTELSSKIVIGSTTVNNNNKGKILSLNSIRENNHKKEQTFYSIVVPKGRRYVVILPDSSEVHLNSESELRLPDYFLDTIRNIELKGEGFFKVKHNAKAPFVVRFNNNREVKVLGTEFNINAYNNANSKITLAIGSVIVNSGMNSATLVPSQQAVINDNNTIETHTVIVSDFTAWVNGAFNYTNTPFSEIVEDLCRRYNYKFKIVDKELNKLRLTIKLDKNTTITDMIKALNRAGDTIMKVRLDIESSSILISK